MRRRRRFVRLAFPVALIFVVAACVGQSPASPSQASGGNESGSPDATGSEITAGGLAATCEAGAKEGALSYFATFEPDNFRKILKPFEQKYPGIDVELVPLRPDDSIQRIIAESQSGSGNMSADLVDSDLDTLQALTERQLINTQIAWSDLDVATDLITPTNVVRLYRVPLGIVYNTNKVSATELPDTWEEVIDEKYRQQVVTDPRATAEAPLALVWGREKTVDWVKRFSATVKPVIIQGGTAGMLSVASGEALYTLYGRADSNSEQRAKGAPIDVKYLDVIPTTDFYNAVLVGAKHPNAAACFAGWLASEEGSAIHEEVEFKSNETVPPEAPEGATIAAIESTEDAQLVRDVAAEIGKIYTGQ